jgi:hypothetical protein
LALAEKYFGFTELADDLFGGVSFSWHLTLFPFLILTLQLDQFLGVRSVQQFGGIDRPCDICKLCE